MSNQLSNQFIDCGNGRKLYLHRAERNPYLSEIRRGQVFVGETIQGGIVAFALSRESFERKIKPYFERTNSLAWRDEAFRIIEAALVAHGL